MTAVDKSLGGWGRSFEFEGIQIGKESVTRSEILDSQLHLADPGELDTLEDRVCRMFRLCREPMMTGIEGYAWV